MIYNFEGSDWLLHTSIFGDGAEKQIGYRIALSGNGSTLLYSAPLHYEVSVFRLTNNLWSQIGSSIGAINTSTYEKFGHGLAISYDGSIIAVSADNYAQVYQYQTNQWIQKGSTITSTNTGVLFRVDLNNVGDLLVVSS